MTNRIYPHTPTIKAARLKFTLILLTLLFIGKYAKADVPCHVAIEQQHDSILKLEQQLKTAQSVPYNQGYQEGYKVAKLEFRNFKEVHDEGKIFLVCYCLTFVVICYLLTFLKLTKDPS